MFLLVLSALAGCCAAFDGTWPLVIFPREWNKSDDLSYFDGSGSHPEDGSNEGLPEVYTHSNKNSQHSGSKLHFLAMKFEACKDKIFFHPAKSPILDLSCEGEPGTSSLVVTGVLSNGTRVQMRGGSGSNTVKWIASGQNFDPWFGTFTCSANVGGHEETVTMRVLRVSDYSEDVCNDTVVVPPYSELVPKSSAASTLSMTSLAMSSMLVIYVLITS